ncbi:hypothetical protein BB561_006529, partial [Smittium simulii]
PHVNNNDIIINHLFRYIKDNSKPLSVDSISRNIKSITKLIVTNGKQIPKARAIGATLAASAGISSDVIISHAFWSGYDMFDNYYRLSRELSVGRIELSMLVDTRASCSLFSKALLEKLKLNFTHCGANNSGRDVLNALKCSIYYKKKFIYRQDGNHITLKLYNRKQLLQNNNLESIIEKILSSDYNTDNTDTTDASSIALGAALEQQNDE